MKPKKPLSLKQYFKIGIAIKFEVYKLATGQKVFRQCTEIPGFHTPHVDIDASDFRLHRKGLKFIGFMKSPHSICMELYYQPKKIVAA
jgi:hypothetical protein